MSKMIVVEGPDRTGKQTQTLRLRDYFVSLGKKAVVVEVPIKGSYTYNIIYWMLRNGLAKKMPHLFQVLQFLNRWTFQCGDLQKLEQNNDYVIFDRWSLSTTVYGLAEGLSLEFVNSLSVRLKKPDYTFVLLGDAHQHEAEDVYEKDAELQRSVRRHYAEWAAQQTHGCSVINCKNPRELITAEMIYTLKTARII
jgi:thymidylate kinase